MANTNSIMALVEQLKSISNPPSDSGNRRGYSQAYSLIQQSQLTNDEQQRVLNALRLAADTNQGYYYNSNGIHGTLQALSELNVANDDVFEPKQPTPLSFKELIAKVENGRIFGVSFIKRTTGELRTMSCRLGVKKFLRGGQMAYSPSERQLLTVFDIAAKGYRVIPLEGIRRLSVGGQVFTLGGAA